MDNKTQGCGLDPRPPLKYKTRQSETKAKTKSKTTSIMSKTKAIDIQTPRPRLPKRGLGRP